MSRGRVALAAALLLGAIVGGCSPRRSESSGGPADQASATTRADALIAAGNAAFQSGDYRLAARRYAAAAVHRPDDPAAFYGLGMALAKLGRDEDARAAYARARELGYRQQQQ